MDSSSQERSVTTTPSRVHLLLYALIATFHIISFTLFTVAGFLDSERYVELGSRIFSGLCFIVPAIGACHWAYSPYEYLMRSRNLILFFLLTLLCLGNLILLLAQVTNKNLILAFEALQSPAAAAAVVLALAGFSTLFSAIGLIRTHFHCPNELLSSPRPQISPPMPEWRPSQPLEHQPSTPSIQSIIPGHLSPNKYDINQIPQWRPRLANEGNDPYLSRTWSGVSLR